MSSISQTGDRGLDWAPASRLKRIIKSLEGFFRTSSVTKYARIWHGDFSYKLIQNTAIKNFQNMSPVTSIDAGECYLCIFERAGYQGNYQIIGPGEKAQVGKCASIVISNCKFSVDSVRREAAPPPGYWEMDGPMYLMHFSAGYRFVS
ncbi:MAG TPA: hypothetical protein DEF34_10735 [Desulfotomaculum sp.]|nr:MAG: hypothetical protein VR67_08710 [Peptococcaceae bacterium BRH_c8a]KJS77041.1 MAG: hypothetical protein JL56_04160 [Desulfotomaculum sp. BICA1-6]HBX24088.1 hypothetical protein [Desulfotomaculum sp.]